MNIRLILGILIMAVGLSACGTPESGFRVVQRSDGMIGVQAVKGAKEIEAQELATKECKKNGKSVARISKILSSMTPSGNKVVPSGNSGMVWVWV